MSILDDLLEYERPGLKGTPLEASEKRNPKYFPYFHHYHRTKAGLYLVLRHLKDGSFQKREPYIGMQDSSTPMHSFEKDTLPENFSLVHVIHKKDVNQSVINHYAGVNVKYAVDCRDGSIQSLKMSNFGSLFEPDYPRWYFEIKRSSGNSDFPIVDFKIQDLQTARPSANGLQVDNPLQSIEGKVVDYQATLHHLLGLMKAHTAEYEVLGNAELSEKEFAQRHEKYEYIKEKIRSLDLLVFK
jgi:hypothetical protein